MKIRNLLNSGYVALLLATAVLFVAGCPSAGGGKSSSSAEGEGVAKCGDVTDPVECNNTTTTSNEICEYNVSAKLCAVKVQENECAKLSSSAACDADTANSCAWNASTNKCFQYKLESKVFSEIKAVNEATTYVYKDIKQIVKAGNDSFVYVVNNGGKSIMIFNNAAAAAKIEDTGKWTPETAKGAGAGTAANVDNINLKAVNAVVTYSIPSLTGAVFMIAPGTAAKRQGIAVFNGKAKSQTYSTNMLTSIQKDGGGAPNAKGIGGNGYLGMAVVADDAAGDGTLIALRSNGKVGAFVKLGTAAVIANGIGAAGNGTAEMPVAFATDNAGGMSFIAKESTIDRLPAAEIKVGSSFTPGAGTEYERKHLNWRFGATLQTADILALAFHDDKLYVGLDGGGTPNIGGVVIIDTTTDIATPPDGSMSGTTIKSFAVRGNGDVYAFGVDSIFVFRGANTKPIEIIVAAKLSANQGQTAPGQFKPGFFGDLGAAKNLNFRRLARC